MHKTENSEKFKQSKQVKSVTVNVRIAVQCEYESLKAKQWISEAKRNEIFVVRFEWNAIWYNTQNARISETNLERERENI